MTEPSIIALTLASLCLGAMLFFSAGVAPIVFRVLSMDDGGRFVRALFPIYYLACGIVAALAAVAAIGTWAFWLLALVTFGFAYLRQALMPGINRARDAHLGGDAAAGPRFDRLHRLSVWLNTGQLGLLIAAVIGLAA